jgi:hypothetical protein
LEDAVEYADKVHAVHEWVWAEMSKRRWGHKLLAQHMQEQCYHFTDFNLLRQLPPEQCSGPIHAMYGGAAWGATK